MLTIYLKFPAAMPIIHRQSVIMEPYGVSNYSEQFLKQNSLAVMAILRDLQMIRSRCVFPGAAADNYQPHS